MTEDGVVHGPLVRGLCVSFVTISGVISLGYASLLPFLGADDPAVDWLTGLPDMWPLVGFFGGLGLLQLALAGRGVWSRHSAGGAD